MKPPYTSNFELEKRHSRLRFFASSILWAVALIVLAAIIGGGAFGATTTAVQESESALWYTLGAVLCVVAMLIIFCINPRDDSKPADDTRDWLKQQADSREDAAFQAPPADLTLASARAAHDANDFNPNGFWSGPLAKPFNADDYLITCPRPQSLSLCNLPGTKLCTQVIETGRCVDGFCIECGAPPNETHRSGCSYVRCYNPTIFQPPHYPRPARATDTPDAHSLLSDHVNELDEALGNPPHFDDLSVDDFAEALKENLRVNRELKGRDGWYDPEVISNDDLEKAMRLVMRKGDVISIGAYAMMLHQRGTVTIK